MGKCELLIDVNVVEQKQTDEVQLVGFYNRLKLRVERGHGG